MLVAKQAASLAVLCGAPPAGGAGAADLALAQAVTPALTTVRVGAGALGRRRLLVLSVALRITVDLAVPPKMVLAMA